MISSVSRSGGHAVLAEQFVDADAGTRVDQRAGRQVHRDSQRPAGVDPLLRAPEALAQHHLGQAAQLAGVLGDGHEVLRRHRTVRRVLPPRQALHADQVPVAQVHLGLEVDLQLAVVKSPPHVRGSNTYS